MHPRNKHINGYDLQKLVTQCPELKPYIIKNPKGRETINFFDSSAVKQLNRALLIADYHLQYWDIPKDYLCPPIPGRADYIHAIADQLAKFNRDVPPKGEFIRGLDIGTGANAIYPIIAIHEYDWQMVGSEIDEKAIYNIEKLRNKNNKLKKHFEVRVQANKDHFFQGIINTDEFFDFTICNPPFFSSVEEAETVNKRKVSNLKNRKVSKAAFNFKGQAQELIYEGGETRFLKNMIKESKQYGNNVMYFSTLVSKEHFIKRFKNQLSQLRATEIHVIPLEHGSKKSRILVWSFLTIKQKDNWLRLRWKK